MLIRKKKKSNKIHSSNHKQNDYCKFSLKLLRIAHGHFCDSVLCGNTTQGKPCSGPVRDCSEVIKM